MNFGCPLCHSGTQNIESVEGPLDRPYFHCFHCDLIFASPGALLSAEDELKRYGRHENDVNDPRYVKFLNQAVEPALVYLRPGMEGLDYGSGPGPALSENLRRKGIHCRDYDPLFGPELSDGSFDFIFSTEAFEHFYDPVREVQLIDERLKPGGLLAVMTMWHKGTEHFKDWFYARDDTHVVFYSLSTFDFISRRWNFEILWSDEKRVIIFRKLI
jgi:SAM-dependent methyltransferase